METRSQGTQGSIGQLIGQQFSPTPAPAVFDNQMQPTTPLPAEGLSDGVYRKNFGKFDRLGSTYSWKIHRPHREKLTGHSRPRDQAEKVNKQELLQDCIRRLAARDYLKDGNKIEFYRNRTDDDTQSILLLTMYSNRFVAEPVIFEQAWLIKYLKNFYNPVVNNYGSSDDLFPTGTKATLNEREVLIPDGSGHKDPFDPSRRFKSIDALHDYAMKLMTQGHPKGRVDDYYREKSKAFHDRNIKPIR